MSSQGFEGVGGEGERGGAAGERGEREERSERGEREEQSGGAGGERGSGEREGGGAGGERGGRGGNWSGDRDGQAGAHGVGGARGGAAGGGVGGMRGGAAGGGVGGMRGGAAGGGVSGARGGDEVAGYAAEVRAQFADLPEAESAELLEDLEDHLREVAAEGAGTLRERLGAPAAYARELRQAAGLPEPGEGSGSGGDARLRRSLRQVLGEAERWARGYRAGREVLDFLPSLRPAWWVLRAWAAVRLLEVVTTSVNWHELDIIPRIGESTFVGLLALLVAVPASVYAARQTVPDGWRRRVMGAGEGVLALFVVATALSAVGHQGYYDGPSSQVSYVQQSQPGLADNGRPISNLYVYDHSGKLLDGALVYDQSGQPVNVAQFGDNSLIDSGGWLDGNGALIPNAFPQQILQQRWDGGGSGPNYVAVPPPAVNVPQGVHRATAPADPQQSSATPSPTPSQTPATSSSTPGPATSTPPSSSSSGGATGAHPSSALPSTPQPSSTTG